MPGMTNFFVYMIGVILVVGALAYGASLAGLSPAWIGVLALTLAHGFPASNSRCAEIGSQRPRPTPSSVNTARLT